MLSDLKNFCSYLSHLRSASVNSLHCLHQILFSLLQIRFARYCTVKCEKQNKAKYIVHRMLTGSKNTKGSTDSSVGGEAEF